MHNFFITVLWRFSTSSLLLVKTVVRGQPGKHHSACQRWGWTTSTLRWSHLVLGRQNISFSWSWKLSQGRVCDLIQANDTSSGPLDLMKVIRTPCRSWTSHLSLPVTSEITSQPQDSCASRWLLILHTLLLWSQPCLLSSYVTCPSTLVVHPGCLWWE